MKFRMFLPLAILLILACGLPASASPEPQVTEEPVIPTETSAADQAGQSPSNVRPTGVPLFLRDDFEGELAPGWTWKNENPDNWSLSTEAGWLEIMVASGHITGREYTNVLLRPVPGGDFQIETALRFVPTANYQFAGLIVYRSDADFIQAGRAYCVDIETCIGEGLYLDNYANSTFQYPNFATPYDSGELVYLRLQRRNEMYTFFSSPDGTDWTEIGGQENDMDPLFIGLIAAQNGSNLLPALFDYFEVIELH
jgi:beta-xylosidase